MSKRASLVDVGLHRKGAAIPAAQDPEPEAEKERLVKVSVGLSPALYERLKLFGVRGVVAPIRTSWSTRCWPISRPKGRGARLVSEAGHKSAGAHDFVW